MSTLTDRVDRMDNWVPPTAETHEGDKEDATVEQPLNNETTNQHASREEQLRQRLRHNHQGMGGNNNYHRNDLAPDDPFAKVKFTIPTFSSAYDFDAYLD